MEITEVLIFSVLIFLIVVLAYVALFLKLRLSKVLSVVVQLEVDKRILQKENFALAKIAEESSMPDKEGFIAFLSQSRDSAFTFIESFQKSVMKLKAAIIAKDDQKILEAYKEIMEYVPDEKENN